MWPEIIEGSILVGIYVYHRLNPPPDPQPAAAPSSPRVDAGAPIPMIYGRCRVRSPIMAWGGNFNANGNALGGFDYSLDMLFVLGMPFLGAPLTLHRVFAGDVALEIFPVPGGGGYLGAPLVPGQLEYEFNIHSLGGPGAGGQLSGFLEAWTGDPAQQISDGVNDGNFRSHMEHQMSLGGVDSTLMPSYRNLGLAFFYQFEMGESTQIQNYSFEVSSFSAAGLGPQLPTDADPAAVIYDLLTSPLKLGMPTSKIDMPSFIAASATLYTERHGYSIAIETPADASSLIDDVLRQIDGTRYEEPTTGKVVLKLIRGDYDPTLIPNINPGNCVALEGYSNSGFSGLPNAARVIFTNRARNYADDDVVSATGAIPLVVTDFHFPGCCDRDLALRLAARERAVVSRPLVKCTVRVNRDFSMARPGDPVTLTWPAYGITNMVMRIARADLGQLHKGEIALDIITDAFDHTAGSFGGDDTIDDPVRPLPLTKRYFTEAPRWLQQWAAWQGLIASPDPQRVLAAATPDDAATTYSESTGAVGVVASTTDVQPLGVFRSARVAVAYPKTLEPYDTTTGIVIDTIGGAAMGTEASDVLSGVIVAVGGELLSYGSATDLGGGTWRLNNVGRGEIDTATRDHAIGELVFWLSAAMVGRTAHHVGSLRAGRAVPQLGTVIGSGEEAIDVIAIRGRSLLPNRVADLALAGFTLVGGTTGLPVTAGHYKAVARLEEGVDLFASRRARLVTSITRGDAGDEAADEVGITYLVRATKVGGAPFQIAELPQAAIAGGHGYVIGGAGHGTIDVGVLTKRVVQPGEAIPDVPVGTILTSWDESTVRVAAPTWRNLLANARFDYGALAPGWTLTGGGSTSIGTGALSLRRDTTGFYVTTGAIKTFTVKQQIAVDGYLARGMQARLVWYRRNLVSGSDLATATIDGLDASNANTGTATSGSVTGATGNWTRASASIAALGAGTTQLLATLTGANDAAFTELELICGTFIYDVLTNGSFESGVSTGWTLDAGGFVAGTAIAAPSATYSQGGAFATNTQHQDYTIAAGMEFGGVIVLRAFRAQTLSGDAGTITVQVLEAGGSVVASATTGAETLGTLNRWERRTLAVDVPTTGLAKTVRVIWTALRSLGSGNSGACVDELVLSHHKNLDPSYERILRYDTPTVQPTPATWQEFHLAYPAILPVPTVFGAGAEPIEIGWSDGVSRTARVGGPYSASTTSIAAYRFARASGGGALDYHATGIAAFGPRTFGAFETADSFSVITWLRVEEVGFATACGITGRRDAAGGWSLELDATGHVVAILQGDLGTKSIARTGSTVIDGARHLAALVYDAVAQTLTVYDERGSNTVSTATGLGEIASGAPTCVFRIGRSRDTIDTLPGAIEREYVFDRALTSGEIASLQNYALDPTGLAPTVTRSVPAWSELAPDSSGAVLACMATDQLALMYSAGLTTDGGTGYGLALSRATANIIPSFDFANPAFWKLDAGASVVDTRADATGQPVGRNVSISTTDGFYVQGLAMTATATLTVVLYLQADAGSAGLSVELRNASSVVKNTQAVAVTSALWRRYVVAFTGWDNSTPTAQVRIRSSAGTVAVGVTHVCFAAQGTDVPSLIPDAVATLGAVNAVATDTIPAQLNSEGELVVVGVATNASPAAAALARVSGPANVDRRELEIVATAVPRLDHYDGASTNVTSSGTAIDWTQLWTVRGRWCRAKLLDNAVNPFAGVVTTGSVASAVYGRSAIWTASTTALTTIAIGSGTVGATASAIIRSVTVRAREQKLV